MHSVIRVGRCRHNNNNSCVKMKRLSEIRIWLYITFLLLLTPLSQESCEIYKKSVTIYKIERVLYKFVACVNMTAESDLRSEFLSKMKNSSSQYLEITNSSTPELTKEMFVSLNLTQLTIEAKVQMIQEKAFERSNISTIILDNNDIKKIKNSAFKSFAVYVLSLKNNSLSQLSDQIFIGLGNLRKLNLQNNRLVEIHSDSFKDLMSLEELNLSYNKLSNVPQDIFNNLGLLQTIYLNNNYLKQIGKDQFIKNHILQYLMIQNNYLNNLDATSYPPSLLYISAEKNRLDSFNISNLINLNRLILDSNKLTTIRNSLNNLTSLSNLHLNNNFLGGSNLNDTFEHLKNLSVIEIDNNHLKNFDFKLLKNLPQLEGISLVDNELTNVDLTEATPNIKILNLSSNPLVTLKNLSNLANLVKLELSHNYIQDISFDMFTKLYKLQSLSLHYNNIKTLSLGCFRDLKTLTELDLSHNRLSNISAGIFNGLNSIVELDISYNNLDIFDEDVFHNTKNLRYLSIAYNNLSNVNIRRVLSHTIWLREINLNGNNWTCRSLVNIVRENKIVTLTGGNHYNVSNIYGIPCTDLSDQEELYTQKNYFSSDINDLLNSTKIYVKDISFKLSILNTTIILAFVMICCKFIYDKYSTRISVAKQFIYQKTESDQEIHLI